MKKYLYFTGILVIFLSFNLCATVFATNFNDTFFIEGSISNQSSFHLSRDNPIFSLTECVSNLVPPDILFIVEDLPDILNNTFSDESYESLNITSVPEPSSMIMVGVGLL